MAVRGLGCPVRFSLTAGHRGDAPAAGPLIEGLAAEVVMADTAYDSDDLRQKITRTLLSDRKCYNLLIYSGLLSDFIAAARSERALGVRGRQPR